MHPRPPIFNIAIPDTFTSNYKSLLQRTLSAGDLARACTIFSVKDIFIYRERKDDPQTKTSRHISKILNYLETPQYLRKTQFKKDPELRYVGMLPPLRAPHHKLKVPNDRVETPSMREGVVTGHRKGFTHVYVGLENDALVDEKLENGLRVTVEIVEKSEKGFLGRVVEENEIVEYWGYHVHNIASGLGALLRSKRDNLIVLTSRKGKAIMDLKEELMKALHTHREALLVFGGVKRGVYEILEEEGVKPEDVSEFVVNFIPNQKTATVRIEEAVYIALGVLNIFTRL